MSIQIENILFPSTAGDLFLAGAGVRGLNINGTFIKFTAIAVYLPDSSLASLAPTWKGKTGSDLAGSPEFFKDVIKGEFEKFTRVTMILPLKGEEYAGKVTENCVAIWKENGVFTESEAEAVEKFKEVFKEKCFGPGQSILFTQYPDGKLKIAFSKNDSIPEKEDGIIANKALSEAVLESIIGEKGVSPEAKHSLAERISKMLDEFKEAGKINGNSTSEKK